MIEYMIMNTGTYCNCREKILKASVNKKMWDHEQLLSVLNKNEAIRNNLDSVQ